MTIRLTKLESATPSGWQPVRAKNLHFSRWWDVSSLDEARKLVNDIKGELRNNGKADLMLLSTSGKLELYQADKLDLSSLSSSAAEIEDDGKRTFPASMVLLADDNEENAPLRMVKAVHGSRLNVRSDHKLL